MTLKRREKRRYISVMHNCSSTEAQNAIEKRIKDLYGAIALKRTSLKTVRSGNEVSIFRCDLDCEQIVLVAIALARPAMVTLDMSSSLSRLKKRSVVKVNTALLSEKGRG